MSLDPFKIDGPTCISFSDGRTSAYMLWRVLESNNGLPSECIVCFANTGKEMPETLYFVQECGQMWNVPITWLEYRAKTEDGKKQPAVVDYQTASRKGEPYAQLISERTYLPNTVSRFCTTELKIRPTHRYVRSLGWTVWDQMIGIRADEARRVAKIRARGSSTESKDVMMLMPLTDAGITARQVSAFWASQPFDLRLPTVNGRTYHGNCDLCFLKGFSQVVSLIREKPERADWWIAQEESVRAKATGDGDRFRKDWPYYSEMKRFAITQSEMIAFDPQEEAIACFCGE